MCIIVVKPETRTIPLPVLEHCWDTNLHGGGFALPDGAGGVTIHKALDWEEFVTVSRRGRPSPTKIRTVRPGPAGGPLAASLATPLVSIFHSAIIEIDKDTHPRRLCLCSDSDRHSGLIPKEPE